MLTVIESIVGHPFFAAPPLHGTVEVEAHGAPPLAVTLSATDPDGDRVAAVSENGAIYVVTTEAVGDEVYRKFAWAGSTRPVATDPVELLLNNTWRPTLSITGADGLPALVDAGNVQLPFNTLKLSFRLPPSLDADAAAAAVTDALTADTPPLSRVTFDVESTMAGWDAPPVAAWLEASMNKASEAFFGKPSMYMGTGGTIPFMGMLGERFPEAQFLITGLLGPKSNAHGPNEFLHIESTLRLTACVARVLADHAAR